MSADNLEESTPGPAMRSRDTGQRKAFFDSSQLTPTWMRNIRLQPSTLTRKYGGFQFGSPVVRTAVRVDGRCEIFSLLVVV